MSAAGLNSRALTVRGTLPQIGSFSLGAKRRGNLHRSAQTGWRLLRSARNDREIRPNRISSRVHPIALRQIGLGLATANAAG